MVIDLSIEVSQNTPVYHKDPKMTVRTIDSIKKDGWKTRRVTFNTHFSTHIDAPSHMVSNGKNLDEFPVSIFAGNAQVVDVTGLQIIDKADLPLLRSKIVFFKTAWIKNAYNQNYFIDNPVLTVECAELIAKSGVEIIGIDSWTPDNIPFTVHKVLFAKDILIVENLCNLDLINKEFLDVVIAPLKLTQTEGAPVRVFGFI